MEPAQTFTTVNRIEIVGYFFSGAVWYDDGGCFLLTNGELDKHHLTDGSQHELVRYGCPIAAVNDHVGVGDVLQTRPNVGQDTLAG